MLVRRFSPHDKYTIMSQKNSKENIQGLTNIYHSLHPQIHSDFGEEMPKYWGNKWKANTTIGKLRTALVHKPGKEFLSVGQKTPWPPHESSLEAWRMTFKPDLAELVEHYENLVKAYREEGVRVVVKKPDPYDPKYHIKSIYTDDVCHPAVYGQVILRMYDWIRKGEEIPTYQTLAEIGCPVVGMIMGDGMVEGGSCGWLDEKHLFIEVHFPRGNTTDPIITKANEWGQEQYAHIVKLQDPEVDIKIGPGYGTSKGTIDYAKIDRHTSVGDPRWYDHHLVEWMKKKMNWRFITPPDDLIYTDTHGSKIGPNTGIVLEPMKIMVPTGNPKNTKWLESIGVEVVEVECSSLVRPRNSGSIHCTCGSLERDSEPSD
jgi:N-dimethylarginine dimethylaminohydrolase